MASPILLPPPFHSTPSPSGSPPGEFPILYPSQMSFLNSLARRTRSRGPVPPPLQIPFNTAPVWVERSPMRSPHPSPGLATQPSPKRAPAPTNAGRSALRVSGSFGRTQDDDEEEFPQKSAAHAEFHSGSGQDATRKLQKRRPSPVKNHASRHPPYPEKITEAERKGRLQEGERRRPVPLTPYHQSFEHHSFVPDDRPSPFLIAMPTPTLLSDRWRTGNVLRSHSRAQSDSNILTSLSHQADTTPLKRSSTTTPRPLTPSLRRTGSAHSVRPGRKRSVSFLLPLEKLQPGDHVLPSPRSQQTSHPRPAQSQSTPDLLHTNADYFSTSPTSHVPPTPDQEVGGQDHSDPPHHESSYHRAQYHQYAYEQHEEGKCTTVASTRKGFFNRRGDQLVDNDGGCSFSTDPYPLDLASYPRCAWQDEKGRCIEYYTHTFIDFGSRRWMEVMGLD